MKCGENLATQRLCELSETDYEIIAINITIGDVRSLLSLIRPSVAGVGLVPTCLSFGDTNEWNIFVKRVS